MGALWALIAALNAAFAAHSFSEGAIGFGVFNAVIAAWFFFCAVDEL